MGQQWQQLYQNLPNGHPQEQRSGPAKGSALLPKQPPEAQVPEHPGQMKHSRQIDS